MIKFNKKQKKVTKYPSIYIDHGDVIISPLLDEYGRSVYTFVNQSDLSLYSKYIDFDTHTFSIKCSILDSPLMDTNIEIGGLFDNVLSVLTTKSRALETDVLGEYLTSKNIDKVSLLPEWNDGTIDDFNIDHSTTNKFFKNGDICVIYDDMSYDTINSCDINGIIEDAKCYYIHIPHTDYVIRLSIDEYILISNITELEVSIIRDITDRFDMYVEQIFSIYCNNIVEILEAIIYLPYIVDIQNSLSGNNDIRYSLSILYNNELELGYIPTKKESAQNRDPLDILMGILVNTERIIYNE